MKHLDTTDIALLAGGALLLLISLAAFTWEAVTA